MSDKPENSGSAPAYGSGFGSSLGGSVNYGVSNEAARTPAEASQEKNAQLLDLGISKAAGSGPVKDITTAEFMGEVIEASQNIPVLVDFWAPWCEPCKQLTPALEAAVAKADGRVRLVKMNIEDHPEVAGQMGIQSIPAVVAFDKGQPKDAFMGLKTEAEITKFIDKLAGPAQPSKLDQLLEEASGLMEAGSYQEAGQIYSAILQQLPDNLDAVAGLGNVYFKLGDIAAAKEILANVGNADDFAPLKALSSAIDLEEQAGDLGEITELENRVSANPKDHQARYDLAIALNAKGRHEEAADHLLDIIAKDRKWQDDGAKAQLLKFFEAWGPKDEATLAARRKLSSLLFS